MIRRTLKKVITYIRLKICILLTDKKTVLLVSHDFSLSGAPVVLMNAAEILKQHGYKVVIISPLKGQLEESLKRKKIRYFVFYEMIKYKDYKRLLKKVPIIIVNTIVNYETIEIINSFTEINKKILWWIHEGDTYLEKFHKKILYTLNDNFLILPVSEYVKEKLDKYNLFKNNKKQLLPYFIENNQQISCLKRNGNYNIAIIGSICPRKNQIEIVDALNYLEKKMNLESTILFIVGDSIDDNYYEQLQKQLKYTNVKYKLINSIPRAEMNDFYQSINLLVCTSIDDPLPVVVTEAMQNGIPILCSNKTGHYSLITDSYNGFTYNVGNVEELGEKIKYIKLINAEEISNISFNEKKLVEDMLSKKSFECRLISIMED